MERFASCVFCGGHTVFCVVVVTKVEDSYLMNKTTVLAPADGWPVEGPRSETRQFDNRCSLLHDLNPEANQTKYKTLFQSYFSYFLRNRSAQPTLDTKTSLIEFLICCSIK